MTFYLLLMRRCRHLTGSHPSGGSQSSVGGGNGEDATVMGFKGLERPVVVLAIDGFHPGVARDVMYTGMSRARDQLIVIGDLELIRDACGSEVCKRLTEARR